MRDANRNSTAIRGGLKLKIDPEHPTFIGMSDFHPYPVTTDWLRARASASPGAVALIDYTVANPQPWRYAELDGMAERLGGYFRSRLGNTATNVAVLLPNSLAYVVLIYALNRIGATLVPLNTRLTPAELRQQIESAACSALVCSPSWEKKGRAASANLCALIVMPDTPGEFAMWVSDQVNKINGPKLNQPAMEDRQAIVFTSGTSGTPKGAVLSYANHFWSAVASAFRLGIDPDERWLACLPLYHVGGLAILFRSCLYGTAVVLHNGFETQEILDSLSAHRVTLVSLVPTMLYRLLHENIHGAHFPSLRMVLLGGAAASGDLLEAAHQAGLPVATTYGLTEAASQVATALPAQVRQKPGSVGHPQLFTTIQVLDQAGSILPAGEIGEITVSGPTVMAGYFADDSATNVAIRNGRLHTGDLGYWDEGGDLWVLDRRDDLIISGGENIYPIEVETVLRSHPAVSEACVVGLPHPEWGQQVIAAVRIDESKQVTQSDLATYCRSHLAGYKQPRQIFFVKEFPQTASGKIQRSMMAARLAAMAQTT